MPCERGVRASIVQALMRRVRPAQWAEGAGRLTGARTGCDVEADLSTYIIAGARPLGLADWPVPEPTRGHVKNATVELDWSSDRANGSGAC